MRLVCGRFDKARWIFQIHAQYLFKKKSKPLNAKPRMFYLHSNLFYISNTKLRFSKMAFHLPFIALLHVNNLNVSFWLDCEFLLIDMHFRRDWNNKRHVTTRKVQRSVFVLFSFTPSDDLYKFNRREATFERQIGQITMNTCNCKCSLLNLICIMCSDETKRETRNTLNETFPHHSMWLKY